MTFSWVNIKKRAIDIQVRRARTMAKSGANPSFNIRHPDYVRDAQNNNFTKMTNDIKADVKKRQDAAMQRRLKLAGKA